MKKTISLVISFLLLVIIISCIAPVPGHETEPKNDEDFEGTSGAQQVIVEEPEGVDEVAELENASVSTKGYQDESQLPENSTQASIGVLDSDVGVLQNETQENQIEVEFVDIPQISDNVSQDVDEPPVPPDPNDNPYEGMYPIEVGGRIYYVADPENIEFYRSILSGEIPPADEG